MNALLPLGMVSDLPSENQTNENRSDESKDYFVERDGMKFAGMHLLVDIWDASQLDDPDHIDAVLREAATAASATILHSHFHNFTGGGVSGVLVLAESHISIHTWPERNFAAIDIFMCGACDPYRSLPVIERAFAAGHLDVSEQRRGRVA